MLTQIKRKIQNTYSEKYKIDFADYDFLDLGAKKGGSIDYCQKRFGAKQGLGIDLGVETTQYANETGHTVLQEDALKFTAPIKFRFTSMLDFLEHLPTMEMAQTVIKNYSELSTDFLFIRHPSFEDIDYLKELGLKITWHDWEGHTNLMRLSDYADTFHSLGLNQYCFFYRKPIYSSDDPVVIPVDAPVNEHAYDKKMGKKESFKFPRPLFGQIDIFVALRKFEKEEWNRIVEGSYQQA